MHSTAIKVGLAAVAALMVGGTVSPAQAAASGSSPAVPVTGSAKAGSVRAVTADGPQPVWGPATISWKWFRNHSSWHSGGWFVPVNFKTRVSMKCHKRRTKVRATLYARIGGRTYQYGTTGWKFCDNRTHSVTSRSAGPISGMRVRIDQTGPDASVRVWEKLVPA
ncbi:hypothetical protein ACFVH6_33360 [Spirillospora sp. NPDC127200]